MVLGGPKRAFTITHLFAFLQWLSQEIKLFVFLIEPRVESIFLRFP